MVLFFKALKFFQFSDKWISFIKELITTSKCSVLVNRTPCGFFGSSCGFHQGDPLSPYLFVLAEEILSLNFSSLQRERKIYHVSPIHSTPCHLFYADDILIFLKAPTRSLQIIKNLLDYYQRATSQVFNLSKSKLFMGRSSPSKQHSICSILAIPQSHLPSTYLGIPLFLGSLRHKHFTKLLNFLRSRLDGWKMKSLSFTGRLVLVRNVLASIPLHISKAIPIPIRTCLQIEKTMRKFLWSSNSTSSKGHIVRWDIICLPMKEGGLGIRRVSEINDASMLRLGWEAVITSFLWATWFKKRCFKNFSIWHPNNPLAGSCIWRKIRSLASLLQSGSRWTVGDGNSIRIWYDRWLDLSPNAPRLLEFVFSHSDKISAIIRDRNWFFPDYLPQAILHILSQAEPIDLGIASSNDALRWEGNSSCHVPKIQPRDNMKNKNKYSLSRI